jgi:hypothetical protein
MGEVKMMQKRCILLDLERTISNGVPYFWKGNKHGYTTSIQHAGLFAEDFAERIVKSDLDKTTIMIHQDLLFKILGKDLKQNESIY